MRGGLGIEISRLDPEVADLAEDDRRAGVTCPDEVDDAQGRVGCDGKPTLEAAPLASPCPPAVIIPTTWPLEFTKGPPESPGLILASVWIIPVRCSVPPWSSPTVIERPTAVTVPAVTVGSPPCPRAFPIATISCPNSRADESPMVTIANPETCLICSRATSAAGSTPSTLAK
jgi:hypothetical protein